MLTPRRIVIGCLLVAAGCGAHSHRGLSTGLDHDHLIEQIAFAEPLAEGYSRLAVAASEPGAARGLTLVEDEREFPFDLETFDRTLVRMLRQSEGFDRVRYAGGPGVPGGAQDDLESDLVLKVELDSQSIAYVDGSEGWAIALWYLFLGFPTWWIHDQTFQIEFTGKAIILDGISGEELTRVDLGTCSAEESLSFHERTRSLGPYLLALILPPPAIGHSPEALMEALLPAALAEPCARLREAFLEIQDRPSPAEVAAQLIRIYAPSTRNLQFDFQSPKEGNTLTGETVDLAFDLVFPGGGSDDLSWVTINGKPVIKYEGDQPVPLVDRVPVRIDGVSFVDGRISIAVKLRSKAGPLKAEIQAPSAP